METKLAYVNIKFKDDMTESEIRQFIKDNLVDIQIVEIDKNKVKIEWGLSEQEGVHGIEETMYYLLNDNELGEYNYILST